jgi:hypothetical protein
MAVQERSRGECGSHLNGHRSSRTAGVRRGCDGVAGAEVVKSQQQVVDLALLSTPCTGKAAGMTVLEKVL